ncbi:MAG TPA: hypothetical protein VME42_02670 [Steroidobacteraceae bacterium]|nr:hypothetical protein [Steroidobacteraceae bacterium]
MARVTCVGVFNPVLATYRLEQIESDRMARTLSAWSVTSNDHAERREPDLPRAVRDAA